MTSRGLQTRRPCQFHFTLNQHSSHYPRECVRVRADPSAGLAKQSPIPLSREADQFVYPVWKRHPLGQFRG